MRIPKTDSEKEASEVACELLRRAYLSDAERNVGAFDDNWVINRYPDAWSCIMDGWKERERRLELILPINGTIFKMADANYPGSDQSHERNAFMKGAMWLRDKLKSTI